MQEMKRVVFINGSPKMSNPSASNFLNSYGEGFMKSDKFQVFRVNVRDGHTHKSWEKDFDLTLNADALVFTFPLYIFCLPAILMRFLQDFNIFLSNNGGYAMKPRVYAIVNCGFPEGGINSEAIGVIECFSKKTGADFRFGIMIGGGGMLSESMKDIPYMKQTFMTLDNGFSFMAQDIQGKSTEPVKNFSSDLGFPRKLYLFMADKGWIQTARKNGLTKKQLYARPYLD